MARVVPAFRGVHAQADDAARAAIAPDETSRFSVEGEVVQICDGPGERWVRIVVTGASVVHALPADVAGLHLGDRVVLECAIAVERVRPSPDSRSADVEQGGDAVHGKSEAGGRG